MIVISFVTELYSKSHKYTTKGGGFRVARQSLQNFYQSKGFGR